MRKYSTAFPTLLRPSCAAAESGGALIMPGRRLPHSNLGRAALATGTAALVNTAVSAMLQVAMNHLLSIAITSAVTALLVYGRAVHQMLLRSSSVYSTTDAAAARALCLCGLFLIASARAPPNVLHLVADDMRPQLGAYGQSRMITPHLDALAAESLVFSSAYTQFAYCAPSRNSFMTGRRPERTRCLNFLTDFRKEHGDSWTSMPQFFKNAGYFTSAAGKLFHDGMDDPLSWSYASNQTGWWGFPVVKGDACDPYGNYCAITNASAIPWTDEDIVLKEGLARMRLANASGRPWWVGIGVHRPHWPSRLPPGWTGPEVYPGDVAPPKWPRGIALAPYMSGAYQDGDYKNPALGCPNCSAPTPDAVEYRRWYYAAVSYADHMLGQAIALLDELGPAVRDNTIVVFHSDHGYQ